MGVNDMPFMSSCERLTPINFVHGIGSCRPQLMTVLHSKVNVDKLCPILEVAIVVYIVTDVCLISEP